MNNPSAAIDLLRGPEQHTGEGRLRTFLSTSMKSKWDISGIEWRFPFAKSLVRIQRSENPHCPFCKRLFPTHWKLLIHFGLTHLSLFDVDFSVGLNDLVVVQIVASVFEEEIPVPDFNLRPARYMHSGTMEPLLPMDLAQDSDDDVDESWLAERGERMLNEYEDVDNKEKAICLQWNRFIIARGGIVSDHDAESAAKDFIHTYKDEFPRELLVASMIHLWENCLVNSLSDLFEVI
jgi:hypothetical protein